MSKKRVEGYLVMANDMAKEAKLMDSFAKRLRQYHGMTDVRTPTSQAQINRALSLGDKLLSEMVQWGKRVGSNSDAPQSVRNFANLYMAEYGGDFIVNLRHSQKWLREFGVNFLSAPMGAGRDFSKNYISLGNAVQSMQDAGNQIRRELAKQKAVVRSARSLGLRRSG